MATMMAEQKGEEGKTVEKRKEGDVEGREESFGGLEQNKGKEVMDGSGFVSGDGDFDNEFQEEVEGNSKSKPNEVVQTAKSKEAKMANDTKMATVSKETLNRTRLSNYSKDTKTGNQSEVTRTSYTTKLSPPNTLKISVFERETIKETEKPTKDRQMEMKIKEIAKAIREKVKKQPAKIINDLHHSKIQNKVMMDRSAHRLSPINKPSNSIDFAREQSKLLTFQEAIQSPINPKTMIKQIINKEILAKMWNFIDLSQKLKKTKLKLDPIKHKYPITSFRKAVLEQDKSLSMEQVKKIKERQEKLQQRRFIYNSSRYERYMKNSKCKKVKDDYFAQETSIVLLKRDEKQICNSMQSIQNPQHQHSEQNEALGIFPTQIEKETLQSHEVPKETVAAEEEGSQYNYDFE